MIAQNHDRAGRYSLLIAKAIGGKHNNVAVTSSSTAKIYSVKSFQFPFHSLHVATS